MVRVDYFKNLKKGIIVEPKGAFENNYLICFLFKKQFKDKGRKEILERLIELSKLKIDGNTQSYAHRRRKKHKSYKKCFVCKTNISNYQHHIILLKNGGYDNGINRIPICGGCHMIIHPWM
jgi:hypothetical protein